MLTIAFLTFLIGRNPLAAAAVLVVACSCAFAIATPVAMLASIGNAARRGLVIKGGKYVEALARSDVLLLDKTGTLTLGRPRITDVVSLNGADPDDVLSLAASAERYSEHPLAEAVRVLASERGLRVLESEEFQAVPGVGVKAKVDGRLVTVGRRPAETEATVGEIAALEAQGKALLFVARDGELLGVLAAADTLRPEVPEALRRCREAGIRVVMITGDHADTALAIAGELGIAPRASRVLTGVELSSMDDEQLRRVVRDVNVYARVEPVQKLRIVRALQAQGEVVAVTGDGVNDAPALRAANVGIAMGRSGTDVAREAADIVLADDNFVTIVAAVEEGRGAFDNLRKATFFLVSTSAAMLVALPAAMVLGWPLPLLPAQLLWLNVVTDSLQDITMAFEPKESDLMRRRPRPRDEGILSPVLWERMLLSGLVMAAGTLWLFDWTLEATGSLALARTVALTTVVIYQVFQAWNARSTSRSIFQISPFSNRYLFVANAASLAIHVMALYLPPTQFVLRVEPLPLELWLQILLVAVWLLVAVELHKLLRRRWPSGRSRTVPV